MEENTIKLYITQELIFTVEAEGETVEQAVEWAFENEDEWELATTAFRVESMEGVQ